MASKPSQMQHLAAQQHAVIGMHGKDAFHSRCEAGDVVTLGNPSRSRLAIFEQQTTPPESSEINGGGEPSRSRPLHDHVVGILLLALRIQRKEGEGLEHRAAAGHGQHRAGTSIGLPRRARSRRMPRRVGFIAGALVLRQLIRLRVLRALGRHQACAPRSFCSRHLLAPGSESIHFSGTRSFRKDYQSHHGMFTHNGVGVG